jgi:hypothetical protein
LGFKYFSAKQTSKKKKTHTQFKESAKESAVGRTRIGRNVAVQRIVLDEGLRSSWAENDFVSCLRCFPAKQTEMVWASRGAGAVVEEKHNVTEASFNPMTKRWTIECENGAVFESTFLIAAG